MERAVALARQAEGRTSPNPMVGAVIVRDGEIVGEGFHQRAGSAHAEIGALDQAGERARGATVYVTLEPCCVQGRTPPCTEALIEAGVARVVYGVRDPNPRVDGQGHDQLSHAGIEVVSGLCEAEAASLIEAFTKWTRKGMPFVTAKFAMTLDGKIATRTGHSRWVSSHESRLLAHQIRHVSDVIVVGAGTVIADNPELTTRLDTDHPSHPIRVVVDSRGRSPLEAKVFSADLPGRTVVATTERVRPEFAAALSAHGVEIWRLPAEEDGRVDLEALLRTMGDHDWMMALIEGGSELHGSFFERNLVDRVQAVLAPKIVGGVRAPGPIGGHGVSEMREALQFEQVEVESHGPDLWIRASGPFRSGPER